MTRTKQRCSAVAVASTANVQSNPRERLTSGAVDSDSGHKETAIQLGTSQEHNPIHLDQTRLTPVTSGGRRPGATAAERKRLQRKRALIYERDDWQLFLDPATLPQKAGCHPFYLNQIVLKELVDNGLDTGANVSLEYTDGLWVVHDDGPGINPAKVLKLFSVKRPLLSSKLKRLPLRGMLGNGLRVVMGAVASSGGTLTVETRGHRFKLATDTETGESIVIADELVPRNPGTTVRLSLNGSKDGDQVLAWTSIQIAKCGRQYCCPSSPFWYGSSDLHRLCANVTPTNATVGDVCRDLGIKLDDDRIAQKLTREDVEALLEKLRASAKRVAPQEIGYIGREFQPDWPGYAQKADLVTTQSGAEIPYTVEAWVICSRASEKVKVAPTSRS
jgi:Histidine kinase-, DNA gyrase B-, and HSP90-like ATPase